MEYLAPGRLCNDTSRLREFHRSSPPVRRRVGTWNSFAGSAASLVFALGILVPVAILVAQKLAVAIFLAWRRAALASGLVALATGATVAIALWIVLRFYARLRSWSAVEAAAFLRRAALVWLVSMSVLLHGFLARTAAARGAAPRE
jgi:hypothetical protein